MHIIKLSPSNHTEVIKQVIRVLQSGGIVIYPTETCYGVGVDATNPEAVKKLLAYKERPSGKAISIAVCDEEMARKYVEVNETARNLYKNFLPGPVTVISRSKHNVAQGIEAEDGSLGIRIPDYPFTLELIKQFGKPITATSANLSGRKTPYSVQDILNTASEKNKKLIDLIIDAGELSPNPPSTVVDTRMNDERVLREGSILPGFSYKSYTTYTSYSEEETQRLGERLMKKFVPKLAEGCVIFALQGELGAGKTQFAKGVAKALGITENVTSPTFTIVKEYEFRHPERMRRIQIDSSAPPQNDGVLYHIDTWRMQDDSELKQLGFTDMIKPGNVVVIEWVEKISQLVNIIKSSTQIVHIVIEGENETREIKILS
ncbi:MAG: L-threonylcarbamoyladenylate synthase [Candidatus Roizmanbacteria bacterium]|nr:L-threonylcarbamoyladenylate synthase [Candidatus Roizmanbacteria bacterium]